LTFYFKRLLLPHLLINHSRHQARLMTYHNSLAYLYKPSHNRRRNHYVLSK